MKKYITLTISIFFLASCTKENNIPTTGPSTLAGKWNWVYSSGGFAGQTYTPKTEKKTIRIEYDTNSIYRYYVNDTLKSETRYQLVKGRSIYSQDSTLIIVTNLSSIRQSFAVLHNDTLILRDECYDCFEHLYTRIK
jgi:hypothetical protein